MAQAERERLSVLMFPWLAHGHVTPYLELARRLVATSFPNLDVVVHLVSTPANLAHIATPSLPSNLHLVEIRLPAEELPASLHTTKRLPPRLMPALKHACDLAAPRFGALIDELRPDLVLYDFLQPWAPLEAASRGVPAAHFSTCSAAATAFFLHCLRTDQSPSAFPFDAISLGGAAQDARYTALLASAGRGKDDDSPPPLVPERDRLPLSLDRSTVFVAVKTCADIERKYMDYLSQLTGKEIVPVGPLLVHDDPRNPGGESSEEDAIMAWLDGEDPGSVVLVSFGSEYFLSERQMAQMARGLELSGAPFLWVVRFPDDDNDSSGAARSLPRDYAPARGKVVQGWAPQRLVLAHGACGAFLTHCGWSSVLEAMAVGVPMVALPLHIDQPLNANLALELGAAAARVEQPERFGEFRAEDVARAVRAAVNGEEGKAARRRAAELREVVARNNDGDGARRQVGVLLEKMARLCGKGQGQAVAN
ncbi:beta-D-glucosyl crocetin beta-1,6-glucosyltransferase [Brachypodium distachyon]|uniref:Glycosyltransferase n=1 Tax=Brachypodium distachyon TaxID=15368 RepID=I1GR95_BRADI|nr:beta-D-glucosyl crocetin beta-1,6-glucosyltransferase [Brachypodium distachyon]KQK14698.1 hypothetical protein BRADI_1g18140v3 [Brachypodium distachyon]|eukprot:XP_003559812.1 beta-D-glucosyl crocetin beta-1,6-glucosyltransferase [Brachypodium distachyon]